tara:strand:+ start:492 stop:722 length:231 start_codon:yes stop_codon:yes gene_type:complete
MAQLDPLFTEQQTALFLGNEEEPFAVRTLQRWRLTGYGPAYLKIGKSVRYRHSDLKQYLNSCVRTSTTDTGSANDD